MDEKEKMTLEVIRDIKKAEIYRDCVIVACFTILSIAFEKWWIILFSILVIIFAKALDGGIKNE